ncbi:hypothetical protein VPNG_04328 [Cytospora leucostoma]|uniref:WSC domain-containing protein n=1 Tax=Cytospora leucostoma TaxID=1230097 RepID=A0A423XDU2_9PEZI|nr:hypothetical protein VPNG_04328 [Cytospora leucostoma]
MARFTSASLTAVITLSSAVRAWNDFHIAHHVQADTATPVSVDVDSDAVGYRIYLATTPPGWGTGPVCWLVNYTDSSVTSVDVTIPAFVVPDGTSVSLSYSELEYSDEYGYEGSSYEYSNDFDLEGGTGEWSALELSGSSITSPDNTPCTALQCTRDCGGTYYPDGNIDYPDDEDEVTSEFLDTYESYYNCVAACPGNDYPPWREIMGDDDGDDDDDDDTYSTASYSRHRFCHHVVFDDTDHSVFCKANGRFGVLDCFKNCFHEVGIIRSIKYINGSYKRCRPCRPGYYCRAGVLYSNAFRGVEFISRIERLCRGPFKEWVRRMY